MKNYFRSELWSGLIWIGREWWAYKTNIPSEQEVKLFLQKAIDLGITFFDTAPAYWASEIRLWAFLYELDSEIRNSLFIATKCGEFWREDGTTYVNHDFSALKESVDRSIWLLGSINLMQLHKASVDSLESIDTLRVIEYSKSLGIPYFGVSISDVNTWMLAISMPGIDFIQLPYNYENHSFLSIIQEAKKKWKKVITNRPFWMGKLIPINTESSSDWLFDELFRDIILSGNPDIVLTWTKTVEHLENNKTAFDRVMNNI